MDHRIIDILELRPSNRLDACLILIKQYREFIKYIYLTIV